ncbi:hypothetical protein DR73_3854 [Enterobacteriaceae bacterium ATCC 29904]|nr:hypothetical protein DR73_3854 [Enterobacteriaceae bacterium ATCC 29904]
MRMFYAHTALSWPVALVMSSGDESVINFYLPI